MMDDGLNLGATGCHDIVQGEPEHVNPLCSSGSRRIVKNNYPMRMRPAAPKFMAHVPLRNTVVGMMTAFLGDCIIFALFLVIWPECQFWKLQQTKAV